MSKSNLSKSRLERCPSCSGKSDKIILASSPEYVGQYRCRACHLVFDLSDPGPFPTPEEVAKWKKEAGVKP